MTSSEPEPYDAVVLAGGGARRLNGADKPGLLVGGRSLVAWVAASVLGASSSTVVTQSIRNSALQNRITYYTTLSGAKAACLGMQHLQEMRPYDIQSLHAQLSP